VDDAPPTGMLYDTGAGIWQAGLDTRALVDGYHHVTVAARGVDGGEVTDRAWNILVANSSGAPTPTAGTTGPPAARILNPLSNQTQRGLIVVQALVTNATAVAYYVDEAGPTVPMTYNQATGQWQATLDTRTLPDGYHHVTITARGAGEEIAADRAWNVLIANGGAIPRPMRERGGERVAESTFTPRSP
jgi:hypothetical protein